MSKTKMTLRQLDDNKVLIVTGDTLDNNNAHEMVELITSLQDQGRKYIIIDMTNLEFLSSAGIGSIIGTVENSREIGGDIILCNISCNILHILEVLDLKEFLTIKMNVDDAVELAKG
jgi:anti-anti-sigma factor